MPKVKTVTPGRLSGVSRLTSQIASDISKQKEREYLTAVSDWNEEKNKLDTIKQDQLNYVDQKMQMIAGMEQLAGETFDDSFKNNLMDDVRNYASIVSDIKLGNIDSAEGYMKLAKYDKKLNDLQTAIPNINTLASKVNDAINKQDGEVGAMIHDGTGETYNVAKILHDLYHPSRNKNVSYQTIDGQDYIVHKDGQKISIQGLNAIMSGNNPDYPISFAESPDEALGTLYDNMWKRAGNGAYYMKDVSEEKIVNGKKQTVKERKYDIADNSSFYNDLRTAVSPMIDDQEKMRLIWNNIGGEGKWENTTNQREKAIDLLYERAKNIYGPKDNVISETTKLYTPPKSDKDKDKDKPVTDKFDFTLIESIQDQSIEAFKNQTEVPSTLEAKAKGALNRDFKNKEIKIGGSRYQIFDFDVMRNDNGTLTFQPLIIDMRSKDVIPAPVSYEVDKIIDFANDLEQGGELQYNVIEVSSPQEAMKLNPGSVFSLQGKKYIVTRQGVVKPID